ncbi:MAG: hypothetical protein R3E32_27725 [Chitinophagales bacterium]
MFGKSNPNRGQQWDVSDLRAGVYIANWLQDGRALKREKVVVLE